MARPLLLRRTWCVLFGGHHYTKPRGTNMAMCTRCLDRKRWW